MTPALLLWFRIGVYLLMAYTVYTYVRAARRRGYWLPTSGKDYRDLAGDMLTLAGGVFILFMLQRNYQEPMDKVLSAQQDPFPELVYRDDSTGQERQLSALRGQVVLLNLWATWCPPCRAEMPALSDLHRDYAGKGLVVLALSDEDQTTVHGYLQQHAFNFSAGTWSGIHPVLQGINTRPASILINRDGKVVDMIVGARGHSFFSDWVEKVLKNEE
jgi:thiol-disulfide isomerase/thioredoxin